MFCVTDEMGIALDIHRRMIATGCKSTILTSLDGIDPMIYRSHDLSIVFSVFCNNMIRDVNDGLKLTGYPKPHKILKWAGYPNK